MNRKKISGVIALSVIASLCAFHLSVNRSKSGVTDVSLANVEALAQESGNPPKCISAKGFCVINNFTHDHMAFE